MKLKHKAFVFNMFLFTIQKERKVVLLLRICKIEFKCMGKIIQISVNTIHVSDKVSKMSALSHIFKKKSVLLLF